MKIKSIIKLICLVLVLAFFSVWAFNGMTVFTAKFVRPDAAMNKDTALGTKYVAYYTIDAPEDTDTTATEDTDDVTLEDDDLTDETADEATTDEATDEAADEATASEFDVDAEAANAVEVFKKRAEAIGYSGVKLAKLDGGLIRVELPGTSSTSGLEDFFENTGKLEITNDDAVVFTNDDIKSAKVVGYDSDTSLFYAQLNLTKDAKERLKNLTSNGAYSLTVTMGDDIVSATYSGSDEVKNGKMLIGFSTSSYSDALTLVYCVNSGVINGTITAETDMGKIVTASAGDKVELAFGIAVLGIFLLAAVYFIISKKLMGVAATIGVLGAVLLLDFFAATFSWLQVGAMGALGLALALILSLIAIALVLNAIGVKYANGRNAVDAINAGVSDINAVVLEACGIVAAGGIGLWICGGTLRDFGVALFGGAFVAAFISLVFVKFVINIFVGLGAQAKALGLKRGE